MTHYDLAIIGSGSGNTLISPEWDGRRVVLVDGGTFGGTCLNVGCIPTKMYVYPAELASAPTASSRLGVDLSLDGVRWTDIRDRIFTRIDAISAGGRAYRANELENVTLIEEYVRLTGPTSFVTASGEAVTADQLVIAAGSRAVLPAVPGISSPQVHTSDTIMRIDELPKRLLIIGGGYIAAEFAHVFAAFGTTVTIAVRSDAMLRHLDETVSAAFTEQAAHQWDLRLRTDVTALTPNSDGSITARLDSGAGPEDLEVDVVLAAVGRVPNTDTLGASEAGLDLHADGRLAVDEYQRVLSRGKPVAGLWSLGDVSSDYQLKHVANHEAKVVAHNLLHPGNLRASDHRFVPAAVFSHPQLASVGMTEDEALAYADAAGTTIVTAVQHYGSTAYGWAMEDTIGFAKVIAEQSTGRILGAHVLGHEASMIIQPVIQAMSFGLDAHTMARGQYWIHPALTEVIENALLNLKTA
ncbi:mycothione reductase [Arthrobacter agilis]|uniref:mycothione reductase n=1 Tax=Arthrobacter agilis TaxID=37921 RepID=UPI000B350E9E|nr:mycothione reductase [Arthrobacter agilis]OUM45374.1 mycothione reductase [Arthrobacter agilis]PPB46997.1 mycothione reductase [Arthrobacter agilis]TPV23407.1 mycothione reductase [Arthrobacter agilis]VDR31786.1 Mycothione reductase [Arthrobacter agilis]